MNQIASNGGTASGYNGDVAKSSDWAKTVDTVLKDYGKINVLVNIAGVVSSTDSAVTQAEVEWDRVININLKGTWFGIKYVMPGMIAQGGGRIINTTSLADIVGMDSTLAAYSASKGGIAGLTRQVAVEYASKNIQINAIAPGQIWTGIQDDLPQELTNQMLKRIPLGRNGKPEEIANIYLFLASDEAEYISGQEFSFDGGWSIHG